MLVKLGLARMDHHSGGFSLLISLHGSFSGCSCKKLFKQKIVVVTLFVIISFVS